LLQVVEIFPPKPPPETVTPRRKSIPNAESPQPQQPQQPQQQQQKGDFLFLLLWTATGPALLQAL
jgi:hypothetical protein